MWQLIKGKPVHLGGAKIKYQPMKVEYTIEIGRVNKDGVELILPPGENGPKILRKGDLFNVVVNFGL